MGVEWLRPAVLGGLALLAIPLAIHLATNIPVRRVVVPSLRLVDRRWPRARRRRHLRDPWLLALRLFIVAAAVVAGAGPLITTPGRETAWARRTARAVVVDRGLPESARGAVAAVTAAERSTATVAETFGSIRSTAALSPLALAWLSRQAPARRGDRVRRRQRQPARSGGGRGDSSGHRHPRARGRRRPVADRPTLDRQ